MKRTLVILFFLVLSGLGGKPKPPAAPDRVAILEARMAVLEQQYSIIVEAHNNLADVVVALEQKMDKGNQVLGPGVDRYTAGFHKNKVLDKSR